MIMHGVHRGPYLQRGRGIGSFLSSLFRSVVPVLKTVGTNVLKSGLVKDVGRTLADSAVKGGLRLATTALDGGSLKESFGSSVSDAKRAVSQVIKGQQPQSRSSGVKRAAAATSSSRGRRVSRAGPPLRKKRKKVAVWEDIDSDDQFDEDGGEIIEAEYNDSE